MCQLSCSQAERLQDSVPMMDGEAERIVTEHRAPKLSRPDKKMVENFQQTLSETTCLATCAQNSDAGAGMGRIGQRSLCPA